MEEEEEDADDDDDEKKSIHTSSYALYIQQIV